MTMAAASASNPLDFAVVPLHRLRIPMCVGSLAQPLASPTATAAPLGTDAALPDTIVAVPSNGSSSTTAVTTSHKRGVSKHTHRWVCYLRPPSAADALCVYSMIQSVTFRLDRSFNDAIRVVAAPPFVTSDVAWAEHVVDISISFVDGSGLSPMNIAHTVVLRRRVDAEHCPLGLTAANVLSAAEPTRSLVVPDVVGAAAAAPSSSLTGGGSAGASVGHQPFFVSERFDSIMIVHPRRRTFDYITGLQEECTDRNTIGRDKKHVGPLAGVGAHRMQALAQQMKAAVAGVPLEWDPASSAATILATPNVHESAVRAVMAHLMEDWMRDAASLRERCRENSDIVLCKALVDLEKERCATLEDMKSSDMQINRLVWKCRQWVRRLDMRCKRMRGEDVAVDVDSEGAA